MIDVGRNNQPSECHFLTQQFRGKLLAPCNIFNLFRDYSTAGITHFREIAVRILSFAPCDPFSARLRHAVAVIVISRSAVRAVPDEYRPGENTIRPDSTLAK